MECRSNGVLGKQIIQHSKTPSLHYSMPVKRNDPEVSNSGPLTTEAKLFLALAELEALACPRLTWLLSFLHPGITGEEASFFERFAMVGVGLGQSARDGMTDC